MEIIAAIDLETTGLDPHFNDIIEIAIQPLDGSFEPLADIPPFVARIKARRPQNASAKAMEVNGLDLNDGDEYHEFLARLLAWLEEYRIGKIQMLGQNADFDRSFIEANIPELGRTLGHRFIRDSQRLACAYNDLVRLKTGKPAFEKLGLSDLRKALGIEDSQEHRALDDALDAATVYKELLKRMTLDPSTVSK
jgi:DNA polymerase III epsilon subunit-like protein